MFLRRMNFLYYKNFGEEKPVASSGTYKKKKDPRKSRTSHHGLEGHREECTCEGCLTEYPLRTHLLLDMSFSRGVDSDHTSSSRRPTRVSSVFKFFKWRKKSAQAAALREERARLCVRFAETQAEEERKKQALLMNPNPNVPLEPVTLSTVKQDCFMIPVSKLQNFFPAGHMIPSGDCLRLRMVEMNEPACRIVFHMIGPALPFLPSLASPIIDLHNFQKECVVK
ncbi:hypothetical protein Anas_00557, partial [Armadillidium nasatum]